MNRSSRIFRIFLLCQALAIGAWAQWVTPAAPETYAYPRPGAAGGAPVLCLTCVQGAYGLPTWPVPPSLRFVGRFLDSSRTPFVTAPVRTLYAREGAIAAANGRLYTIFSGSRFAAWNLSTFFTDTLTKPLQQMSPRSVTTPELYQPSDAFVDPEIDSQWSTFLVDGVNRLMGFDWDDRRYVYLAYSVYGWGIVKDEPAGFSFVKQYTSADFLLPTSVIVFRSGDTYYALLSDDQMPPARHLFDVTDPSAATEIPLTLNNPPVAKIEVPKALGTEDILAFGGGYSIDISTASRALRYDAPAATILAPESTLYRQISTDGASFYALRSSSDGSRYVDTISPSRPGDASSYTLTSTARLNVPSDGELRVFPAYMTYTVKQLAGPPAVYLFARNGSDLTQIDLGGFFTKYYAAPPSGYAMPWGHTTMFSPALVYSSAGHDYLIFLSEGMADVYEIANTPAKCTLLDIDGNGMRNVADLFTLINFLFAGGPAPAANGDVNGDGAVTPADIFAGISCLFSG